MKINKIEINLPVMAEHLRDYIPNKEIPIQNKQFIKSDFYQTSILPMSDFYKPSFLKKSNDK